MPPALLRRAALIALPAALSACQSKTTPAPDPSPAASSAAGAQAPLSSAAPSASAAAPAGVPVLVEEPFPGGGSTVYAIEGALTVTSGVQAGRIDGDKVEWIGKIPAESPGLGTNIIGRVYGRWPDSVGVTYSTSNGRAPTPTYWPLTGKGASYTSGPGGGMGQILGVATLGPSTLVAGRSMMGTEIQHVRGPAVRRAMTPRKDAGCKSDGSFDEPDRAAIDGSAFVATPDGTVVLMGAHCKNEKPAAEVWAKDGKSSRIIDLTKWWYAPYSMEMVAGKGDDLWAMSEGWSPLLRLHEGGFEALPSPLRPVQAIFASPAGQLHVVDDEMIFRLDGGKWVAVAALPAKGRYSAYAMDDKGTIWASNGSVFRLRPDRSATVPAPSPEKCETPFVYLYRSSWKNAKDFTYPSTSKALASFSDLSAITFVEVGEGYSRYVGVVATTWEKGEAVLAHVRSTMPDEKPALFCYKPTDPRKIELKPAEKK